MNIECYTLRTYFHYPCNTVIIFENITDEEPCTETEIKESTEELISSEKGLSKEFKEELSGFLEDYANRVKKLHDKFSLTEKPQRKWSPVERHIARLTLSQLVEFVNKCKEKYMAAGMEPGTAVGALCAQSIGNFQYFNTRG